jgi:hypothetical protein
VNVPELRLEKLRADVAERFGPFAEDILAGHGDRIDSIHVTGSSLTGDFDPAASDINSVVVLKEMDLGFLEAVAPKGNKYRKKKVSAPLIMTPAYISSSTDVFPIEFLNIKLIHETVYGEDLFGDIEIRLPDLRHQCERELKVKLIGLRQGYISSMGDAKMLSEGFLRGSITGYIPLFRAIISLFGKTPPILNNDVLDVLGNAAGVDCAIYRAVLEEKRKKRKLGIGELNRIFGEYYAATERLGKAVDEITP